MQINKCHKQGLDHKTPNSPTVNMNASDFNINRKYSDYIKTNIKLYPKS